MSDVINAKCFGCGKVIRVPSSYGGRNAKCPQCGHIFTIPTPADSTMELVSDEQLPAVALEEDIVEGVVEEELPPPKQEERPSRHDDSRIRHAGKRPPPRRQTPGRAPHAPRKSNAPIFIGVGIGAVLLIVLLAVALGGKGKKEDSKKDPNAGKQETPRDPEADKLWSRCEEYLRAFRAGNHSDIMEFYAVTDRTALRSAITAMLEADVKYQECQYKSSEVAGGEGTTKFTCTYVTSKGKEEGKLVTFKWKRVEDVWKLADKPSP
jgi:hypothetical protein